MSAPQERGAEPQVVASFLDSATVSAEGDEGAAQAHSNIGIEQQLHAPNMVLISSLKGVSMSSGTSNTPASMPRRGLFS